MNIVEVRDCSKPVRMSVGENCRGIVDNIIRRSVWLHRIDHGIRLPRPTNGGPATLGALPR